MINKNEQEYIYDYFISYADGDEEWVEYYLRPALEENSGKKIITGNTATKPGHPKLLSFQDAVLTSKQVLLIISPEYQFNTQDENFEYRKIIELMKQYHGVVTKEWPIIPLIYKDVSLPLRLDFLTSVDFTDESLWSKNVNLLLNSSDDFGINTFEVPPSPYPGLDAFSEEQSMYFHGRDEIIERLEVRLAANQYIFIMGSSGSGKSSLINAGLLPRIKRNQKRESEEYAFLSMTPGENSFTSLSQIIDRDFLKEPETAISKILQSNQASKLVVIIDQFEETFTLSKHDNKKFFDAITILIKSEECMLIIACRSYFYEDLTETSIWNLTENNLFSLPLLSKLELSQAISRPARQIGMGIDPLLIAEIVHDAGTESGILPFIQVSMNLLWKKIKIRYLSLSAYENLKFTDSNGNTVKGLKAAIAIRASNAVQELGQENKSTLLSILLSLINLGENGAPHTRRPQNIEDLKSSGDNYQKIIKVLSSSKYRLLKTYTDGTGKKVNLVHESIIGGWPLIKNSLVKYREAIKQKNIFSFKLNEWIRLGEGESGLLSKAEILEAEDWLSHSFDKVLGVNKEFYRYIKLSKKNIDPGWNKLGTIYILIIIISLSLIAGVSYLYINSIESNIVKKYLYILLSSLFISILYMAIFSSNNINYLIKKISYSIDKNNYLLLTMFLAIILSSGFYFSYGEKEISIRNECRKAGFKEIDGDNKSIAITASNIDSEPIIYLLEDYDNIYAYKNISNETLKKCHDSFTHIIKKENNDSFYNKKIKYTIKLYDINNKFIFGNQISKINSCGNVFSFTVDMLKYFKEYTLHIQTSDALPILEKISCLSFNANWYGYVEYREGYYKRSIEYFKSSIQDSPNFISPYIGISRSYIKLNNLNSAKLYIKKGMILHHKNNNLINIFAKIYFIEGKYNRSIDKSNEILENNPSSIQKYKAIINITKSFLNKNDISNAREYIFNMIGNDIPVQKIQYAHVLAYRGIVRFYENSCVDALKFFNKSKKVIKSIFPYTRQYIYKCNHEEINNE